MLGLSGQGTAGEGTSPAGAMEAAASLLKEGTDNCAFQNLPAGLVAKLQWAPNSLSLTHAAAPPAAKAAQLPEAQVP